MIIGLDVGGTHTDAVLYGKAGLVRDIKVFTDHGDLFATVLRALERLLDGVDSADVKRMVLSTTLATNLIVQNNLPAVAMVVAAGPGIDPLNFQIGDHYFVVRGALDHRGREIETLDEKELADIGKKIKELGVSYAGVVSKFSSRNPVLEERMAAILSPYVQRVFMGHLFSGALSFPRRIATTYLNAVVYPVHREFFEAVERSLAHKGLTVPIRILKPDGGNMQLEASLECPGQTVLSGPAASVMGAVAYAPSDECCLILDIGGTTTDMAVILNGAPVLVPQGIEIGPYKTLIRALMTRSIGIGGDSVVRIRDGRPGIGPDRLGVAMAYGGPVPTPTDALTVLGLAGGDLELAREGLTPIAEELQLTVEAAAESIFDTACRQILAAAREMVEQINSRPVYTVHEMHEGLQITPQRLLVLGGPAQQFAGRLATLFSGTVEPVPHWHVANAIGCALARTTSEITLYADTAQQVATAAGEQYIRGISGRFNLEDARKMALEMVREKALRRGANPDSLEAGGDRGRSSSI